MSDMAFDQTTLWMVIAGLAVGSYGLRFAFIGLVGGRSLPEWLMRHLRYTAVAIIPALVAPLVVWPVPTGRTPDPVYFAAAALTFAVGAITKNVLAAMASGVVSLYGLLYLLG